MAVDATPSLDSAAPGGLAGLVVQKRAAIAAFRANASPYTGRQARTSPLLLQRFIASSVPELSHDTGCANHELLLVSPQSYENSHTSFISLICARCRHHFHIRNDRTCGRSSEKDHPCHMLIASERKTIDDLRPERRGYNDTVEFARFMCAADDCLFSLEISTMRPKLANAEIDSFKDNNRVFQNLQRARKEDPERYEQVQDSYGSGPATTMMQYLADALSRPPGSGPLKIKKRNKRFMVSFSTDFDPLLRLVGFQEDEDETGEACWFIMEPEAVDGVTPVQTLRARMQDVQAELSLILPNPRTTPAWKQLLRVFHAEYQGIRLDQVTEQQIAESDLILLGCLRDFPPQMFSWAAILLAKLDPKRRDEFLDASLRCIQARSEEASFDITMYRSQFDPTTTGSDQHVQDAFAFFQTSPTEDNVANRVMNKFYTITETDPTDANRALALQHLEVVGNFLSTDLISEVNKRARASVFDVDDDMPPLVGVDDHRMSIASATRLLNIDACYNAEMIRDFASNAAEKEDRAKVIEALEVISDLKRSQDDPKEATAIQQVADFLKGTGSVENQNLAPLNSQHFPSPEPAVCTNAPPGLKNIGNTCYLNSLLQYFYNVKVVRELVLNHEHILLPLDVESVKARRTGGNGTPVNLEEAMVARQFIEMLGALFKELQTTTDAAAQPIQKLANAALFSAKEILSEKPQVNPPPLPARPSPAPPKDDNNAVNVTVEPVNDRSETASTRSSQTLVNEGNDPRVESYVQVNPSGESAKTDETSPAKGEPRTEKNDAIIVQESEDVTMEERPGTPTMEERMAQVTRRLEQSERSSGTAQQDVEEIIGNILEHLMRAIQPDGPMPGKPELQADRITETFFTMIVNCTVKTSTEGQSNTSGSTVDGDILNKEVVPERWITAFPHPDKQNNIKSDLYAALDRYFSYEILSSGSLARYTTIRALPPILHICIQRTDASGVKNKNPVIIPETLFMDRYIETQPGSELWRARRRVWALKERMLDLESRAAHSADRVFKSSDTNGWPAHESDSSQELGTMDRAEVLATDDPLFKDLARPLKRKSDGVMEVTTNGSSPPKRRSTSPAASNSNSGIFDTLYDCSKQHGEHESSELELLHKEESSAFEHMKQEMYRLHAIICHGGGMNAGHYWVWIRDFKKNVWLKYNDSLVTEDTRDSQSVLDELNENGDPYYVAYVRDELKDDLVEVPQRFRPESMDTMMSDAPGTDMQTIEGIAPESTGEGSSSPAKIPSNQEEYAMDEKAAEREEPPPYQTL
ncbi:hypothetical protein F4780DRAFT_625224 [Xylariomycetidae sp. FL0641]|nr:hypothetical protein F4780DRAFT_625224 [Xylariomycetidae sp. FL0641]